MGREINIDLSVFSEEDIEKVNELHKVANDIRDEWIFVGNKDLSEGVTQIMITGACRRWLIPILVASLIRKFEITPAELTAALLYIELTGEEESSE